jgi:hypothetical protein
VVWWQTDDLWYWSREALVTYVRAAADRQQTSVAEICERIARTHGMELGRIDGAQ